jgi:hypothetical protein
MYQALGLLSETNAISVETAGIISRRTVILRLASF